MTGSRWMHVGTILKMNACHYPDKTGWQDKFREFTFRQWNERACRLADGLAALGVRPRDTFAVIAFNRGEWMDIYAGCAKGGQIVVPIMFRLAGPEIEYVVCHSDCKAFIVEAPFTALIDSIRPCLPIPASAYIYLGEGPVPDGYIGFEDWLQGSSPDEPEVEVSRGGRLDHHVYVRNHRPAQRRRPHP